MIERDLEKTGETSCLRSLPRARRTRHLYAGPEINIEKTTVLDRSGGGTRRKRMPKKNRSVSEQGLLSAHPAGKNLHLTEREKKPTQLGRELKRTCLGEIGGCAGG